MCSSTGDDTPRTRDRTYGRGGVGAETGNLLRVYLLDEGAGGRHRRQRRAYVRKAPRRNRVPDIPDGRVVVGCDAPEQSVAVDFKRFREAYVRIVPAEPVANPIIRPLNERADIVGDPPPGKEAHLLHDEIVVHPKPGGCAPLLSGLCIRKSRLQHDGKWRALPIPAIQRVTAELEAAAERGQLQKGGMASRAGLAGLARVEGK